MKISLQLFFLLLFFSCGKRNNNSEIYGSWQTIMEPKNYHGAKDSIVFEKPDSLKIYVIQNGKVVETTFGKFYITTDKSQLITEFDTNKFHFDLIEFMNNSIQARQVGKHAILKYRRLNN